MHKLVLLSTLALLFTEHSFQQQQLAPNQVALNEQRKRLEVDSSWLDKGQKVQHVVLDAGDKEKVSVDLPTENKQLSATAHGNVAVAELSTGQRAQVQRFGDKGGLAQVEGHNAQLKMKEDEEGKHALLKADGQYELDTIARGSLKNAEDTEFEARNNRFDFKVGCLALYSCISNNYRAGQQCTISR